MKALSVVLLGGETQVDVVSLPQVRVARDELGALSTRMVGCPAGSAHRNRIRSAY
jgi:hypothetical protein